MNDIKIKSYSNSSCFFSSLFYYKIFSSIFSLFLKVDLKWSWGGGSKARGETHPLLTVSLTVYTYLFRDELFFMLERCSSDDVEGKLKIHNNNKNLSLIYSKHGKKLCRDGRTSLDIKD